MFNRGTFIGNVVKLDLKSQYPSIMIILNLSPESLHFINRQPYTGKYYITPTLIEVPDEVIGQLRVNIDKADSISRQELLEFSKSRAEYRKIKDKEHESMQLAIKIMSNALYGYNGMEYARYGSFLVAIITTAIGRLMMNTMIELGRELNDVTLIEADTDGLFVQSGRSDLLEIMNEKVREIFDGFDYQNAIRVDADEYDGMISVKMKNYVLLTKKGDILFKGAGFRGRHIPRICDRILHDTAEAIFEDRATLEVWQKYRSLNAFPLDDFVMTVELRTDPSKYAHEGSLYAKLASKVENVEWGDEIRYVKTVQGYIPRGYMADEDLKKILDYKYYRKRMKKMVERLTVVLGPKQVKLA